jgi:hypothetical protein
VKVASNWVFAHNPFAGLTASGFVARRRGQVSWHDGPELTGQSACVAADSASRSRVWWLLCVGVDDGASVVDVVAWARGGVG